MEEKGCDALIVEAPVDLLYYTGIEMSRGILVVKGRGAKLFVDGRYFEACQKVSPVPVGKIESVGGFLEGCAAVGVDEERTTYAAYRAWRKKATVKAVSFSGLRLVKDADEIRALRKSLAIAKSGFNHLRKKLRVGMTEREAALEFEIYCRRAGASKLSFDPIVAFGAGSSSPHYHPGNVKLKKNDTVLVDAGVVWEGYCSDRTRTFVFGSGQARYGEIQKIVKRAHDAAVKVCAAGVRVEALNRAAEGVLEEAGYRDKYVHSLGHGVGLEIHEEPFLGRPETQSLVLEEGMVLTIEPGIYIEGFGGVRYENMILVQKGGCEIL